MKYGEGWGVTMKVGEVGGRREAVLEVAMTKTTTSTTDDDD